MVTRVGVLPVRRAALLPSDLALHVVVSSR